MVKETNKKKGNDNNFPEDKVWGTLQQYAIRLETLHKLERSILSAESLEAITSMALEQLELVIPYRWATLTTIDSVLDEATTMFALDHHQKVNAVPAPFSAREKKIPENLAQKQAHIVTHHPDSAVSPFGFQELPCEGLRSCVNAPLLYRTELFGSLNLGSEQVGAFTEEHLETIREVADQLAIAIQQARIDERAHQRAADLEKRLAHQSIELREVNSDLEAFSSMISHDLRAPLDSILAYANAIKDNDQKPLADSVSKNLDRITMMAGRMGALVHDLLTYSRYTRDSLNLRSVHLGLVVAEADHQVRVLLKENGTQLTIQSPFPNVIGDHTTLVRVVANLLSNAVKFVAPGAAPEVKVWARQTNGCVRLRVEDNGIGIAPEFQERIFRTFERLHSHSTYPGSGLGLAIVRKAVERMGGKVGVESAPGKGSIFWVDLPRGERSQQTHCH
jgi:signal transduction histidine kinase